MGVAVAAVVDAAEVAEVKMKVKKTYFWGVLVLIVLGFFIFGRGAITGNVVGTASANELSIPLSEISAEAKWYESDIEGTRVRYFVVKSSDGTIKTAFDACDVCYGSRKGYRQEGNMMICNNCGNKYPITGLGTENKAGGGCWPGYLPSKIVGDNLVIKSSDIAKGKYRFE